MKAAFQNLRSVCDADLSYSDPYDSERQRQHAAFARQDNLLLLSIHDAHCFEQGRLAKGPPITGKADGYFLLARPCVHA
jgi:hypothetical protein